MSKIIPYIKLNYLIVLSEGKEVFKQTFNWGINILAGDNGIGKSTIMDLIFYSLGGEINTWVKEINECDRVIAEIIINDTTLTLIRELNSKSENPISMFEGNIETAMASGKEWLTFPYRRSSAKKSFSQILFNYFQYPESKTEENSNLTINQLFRLLYVDQHSSPKRLLKEDTEYDRQSIRLAIAEFLLGIDNLEVHNLRQKIIQLNKKISILTGEILSINKFLDVNNELVNVDKILSDNNEITEKIKLFENEILNTSLKSNKVDEITVHDIQLEIDSSSSELQKLAGKKNYLISDTEDSNQFINSLKEKIEIINEAKLTKELLGKIHFENCPICFNKISVTDQTSCPLCKTLNVGKIELSQQYLKIITDIEFQIKESINNIEKRKNEINKIDTKISILKNQIEKLKREQKKYLIFSDNIKADIIIKSEEVGYFRRLIEDNKQKILLLNNLEKHIGKRDKSKKELKELEILVENIEEKRERRKIQVYQNIYKYSKNILSKDLNFEPEFQSPEEVFIDFYKDYYSLNGRVKFSDSSMVILRTSIRFSIFYNSILDKYMRFPRFLLIDNIEDKGMQELRSWNFQKIIIDLCNKIDDKQFQLIYSTSMLPEELKGSKYILNKYYIKGEHTLLV